MKFYKEIYNGVMTKADYELDRKLTAHGIDLPLEDVRTLRRAELTLHRWCELECGDSNEYASWAIERDDEDRLTCTQCGFSGSCWEGGPDIQGPCPSCGDCAPIRHYATGKPFMATYRHTGKTVMRRIPDRENGAKRRVEAVCKAHGLYAYFQTDPRGCALYVSREPLQDSSYSSVGVAIC